MVDQVKQNEGQVLLQPRPKRRLIKGLVLVLGISFLAWELFLFSSVRVLAVRAAGAMGPWAIPLVLHYGVDESEEVRGAVVEVIHHSGPSAAPALLKNLTDPDARRRLMAANLLGGLGPCPDAVPGLSQAARSDPNLEVRGAAIHSLADAGQNDEAAVEPLAALLDDAEGDIRFAAVESLSQLKAKASPAVRALARSLKDADPRVRQGAAEALEQIGPEGREAVPALTEALTDPSPGVRKEAAEALEAIRGSKK